MKRKKGFLYIMGVGMAMSALLASCADDESFSTSRGDVLSFSVDTLKMDTTFSNVPTPTRSFWVYNRTGKALRCQSVRLENGNQKGYRVNVDGSYLGSEVGFQTQNVEIRKGDSIRVFVELTSAMQNSKEPQLVSDKPGVCAGKWRGAEGEPEGVFMGCDETQFARGEAGPAAGEHAAGSGLWRH